MNQSSASATTAESRSTRDRILDAAERLLGKNGPDATSLREITSAAGVNLAAVNYHFQSKDALIRAVIDRRVDPLVRRRLEMLDEAEAEAGSRPVPIERLIDVFLIPVLELQKTCPDFTPLMARMYTEPRLLEEIVQKHLSTFGQRFLAALHKGLPELSPQDVIWRITFAVGSLMHVMLGPGMIRMVSLGQCDPFDSDLLRRQITAFLVGGFLASAPPAMAPKEA